MHHTYRRIVLGVLIMVALLIYVVRLEQPERSPVPDIGTPLNGEITEPKEVSVIATDLEIPWDIAFLPDGKYLVSERPGRLLLIDDTGQKKVIFEADVRHTGEAGLLGIVLHPDFANNQFLYLYATYPDAGEQTRNRVERYRFVEDTLVDRTVIIDNIPGAIYHDGGRLAFGPDDLLYITTGDATTPAAAQDVNSLAGKILRLKDDGSLPADNPFNNAVYSYGHRNPQGLAWDRDERLWSTEHGRSGVLSGLDEINLVQPGNNYGWPEIEGDKTNENMTSPAWHSGPKETWAPASAAILGNTLYFGGLKGEGLYAATLERDRVMNVTKFHYQRFGRIRTVRIGPDGMLYLTTSNRDGRGDVRDGDDKIIRIDPNALKT